MSEEELHTQEIRQYLYQSGVLRFLVAGKEIVKDIRQLQFTFDELVKDVQTEGGKVERIFDKWEENTDHFFQFSQTKKTGVQTDRNESRTKKNGSQNEVQTDRNV
eukprot:TRINITY_DN1957_c0_g1_i6.p1 TRINITY_DN1957_c0_g1~~TRINITY_DN1957_c0_g1_i6.p1  ORF type:complete len:105 (+),score=33.47 TRINITY_DN1957_c0_g1_i6:182-496(+)